MNDTSMITRFAPSPTGTLHVGSARTALFNYLAAKRYGGTMLLRIEDTDTARSKKEYEENILEGLAWLGIDFEGDPVYQSQRTEIYKKYITQLIDAGRAYESEEEKDGVPSRVIRFKNPNTEVAFSDTVRGEVTFDTSDLGDFVIARNREHPLYHLAVVIDDYEMGITHVIRGEDHISNTPRQILLQEAMGAPRPLYTHIPLVLAPDRSKLSKRHGATAMTEFQEEGYLPEALINYLALIGWSPEEALRQEKEEIFTPEELQEHFSLERIQKGGGIFDYEKLKFINNKHLRRLHHEDPERLLVSIKERMPEGVVTNEERLKEVVPIILDHIFTLKDITTKAVEGEWGYFFAPPAYEAEALLWKKAPDPQQAHEALTKVIALITLLGERYTPEEVKGALWDYASEVGRGSVLWPMRVALSGREKSPDPFTLAALFGKKETIARLTTAIEKL